MNTMRKFTAAAFAAAIAVTAASAQQAQTQRVRGTIEKIDGNTLLIKSATGGAPLTLMLTDDALVVGVVKATLADIKEGSYIGSGALPQPDGTQKAVEVHIFAESQRGTGDGHRGNWDGTAYGAGTGTMTNGAVGQSVSSVDGPVVTVKYKDGEKKVVVGSNVPIVRYEVGDRSELKPGAAVSVVAATKKPDGSFSTSRINVGRNGVVPL
jgi:outer membrane lipoprotein SlyB